MFPTWYIGVLLALYWSEPSVKTNSVAKAYLLPVRGLDGAGDGGRSCPSISILEKALPRCLVDCEDSSPGSPPGRSGAKPDILSDLCGAFVDRPKSPYPRATLLDKMLRFASR